MQTWIHGCYVTELRLMLFYFIQKRQFITGTFRHENISTREDFGWGIFWYHGHFGTGTGTFRHKDISPHGCFSTYTFWHPLRLSLSEITFFPIRFLLYSSLVKSDNEIGEFTYKDMVPLCWNVNVPKYSWAKIPQCRDVPMQKVHGVKK